MRYHLYVYVIPNLNYKPFTLIIVTRPLCLLGTLWDVSLFLDKKSHIFWLVLATVTKFHTNVVDDFGLYQKNL